MQPMTERSTCRLCGARDLSTVLSLPPTPPANAYVPADARGERQEAFPLDLTLCGDCGHVQLGAVLSPYDLFQRARSPIAGHPARIHHAESFATEILQRHRPKPGALVLEVGSNDGSLLKIFEAEGYRVQGVEPAVDLAREAIAADVPTFPGFFGPGIAERIEDENGRADIVIASGVLAHADDLYAMLGSLCRLLTRGGLLAFEVPYLAELVEHAAVDTLRHENLDYHAVGPLIRFFHACDLELIAAGTVPGLGGRLRAYAQKLAGPHEVDGSVDVMCRREQTLGLSHARTYQALSRRIATHRREIAARLEPARGKRVVGWGAPARATSLVAALGLNDGLLEAVVDEAAWKHGLLTPGAQLPIVAPETLDSEPPDWIVVLAWDRADAILKRLSGFRLHGGRVLVPLPTVRVW